MKRLLFGASLALLLPFGWSVVAFGQSPISDETRRQALETIERYVKHDVELKGGFLIVDPRSNTPLRLEFDYVHKGVKSHPDGYLTCVDFKDASGTVYDIDVVVAGSGEKMAVYDVFVHKVDGKVVDKKPSGTR